MYIDWYCTTNDRDSKLDSELFRTHSAQLLIHRSVLTDSFKLYNRLDLIMSFVNSIYNNVFRRTSTFALACLGGAFMFERGFDMLANNMFESMNQGVIKLPYIVFRTTQYYIHLYSILCEQNALNWHDTMLKFKCINPS